MNAPRRLLLVSPHFPPDASAGAHRARVIAPYLERYGWRPVVLTVDPGSYEGVLDRELEAAVPGSIEVVRARAVRPAWTRRLGFGDLGLRALPALWRACRARLRSGGIDAMYVTTYPVYPALLERLARRAGVPFVLDLQDPWVGAWGSTVGGGRDGRVDFKSRASRALAERLERRILPRVDGLTAVSRGLLDELVARYPRLAARPHAVLPIGFDPADLARARASVQVPTCAPPRDGRFHLCYVGTALPLGTDVLRAVLAAVCHLRSLAPAAVERLRLHFVGTSNEARPDAPSRVRALAEGLGVGDLVHEHPPRIPFYDALRVLDRATAILLAGTREARYTASKLHPALAVNRPLLAVVHGRSDVARMLGSLAVTTAGIALVTYDEPFAAREVTARCAAILQRWLHEPPGAPCAAAADTALAPALAGRLATLLDDVVDRHV